MTASPVAIALVKTFESCRLVAYRDTGGVLTIGWGHTHGVKIGDTCTQVQADSWLYDDLAIAAAGVTRAIRVGVTQNQFDALASFQFNTGGLTQKECHLRDYLNEGKITLAADEFPRWDHDATGREVPGLRRRRLAEMQLFLKG